MSAVNKSLIVAASVRNAGQYIDIIFNNIKTLTSLFTNVRCVFVESDSYDNTLDLISKRKEVIGCPVELYTYGNLSAKIENRMERICMARNLYLQVIEEKYSDFDYLYVLDFNETNAEPYDKESILSNFNKELDWNMICANQEKMYYDLYALRHDTWMPFNCWNAIGNRPSFMSYEQAHNIFVKSRFLQIDKKHPPIKVNSAFGGSAFIKISSIKGAKHKAKDIDGNEECEWVPFCEKIGNVYINPQFINMRKLSRHIISANNV
jgi:hypothetical protein